MRFIGLSGFVSWAARHLNQRRKQLVRIGMRRRFRFQLVLRLPHACTSSEARDPIVHGAGRLKPGHQQLVYRLQAECQLKKNTVTALAGPMIDHNRIADSFARCARLFRDPYSEDTRLHYRMASLATSCSSRGALGCSIHS